MAGMEPHAPGSGPLLIVLSGPSGVGKDAVLSRMKEQGRGYHFTVTATTRRRRPAERDGVDYIFHSDQSFREMIERGDLIEWAEVHGHLYGVPRAQVRDAMERGLDVIMKIDVQGAATIRQIAGEAVSIFLIPPSIDELAQRLEGRMSETRRDLGYQAEGRQERDGASQRVRPRGCERHRTDRRHDPQDRSHRRARTATVASTQSSPVARPPRSGRPRLP